jgi:hypothetical protein
MGVNFIEWQVLLCQFSVERVRGDYGVDLLLFTYGPRGQARPGHIPIQVKSTERASRTADSRFILLRVQRADLVRWLAEPMPLILILYEAAGHTGWWLDVQADFAALPRHRLFRMGARTTLRIPAEQILNEEAVRHFDTLRDQAMTRA